MYEFINLLSMNFNINEAINDMFGSNDHFNGNEINNFNLYNFDSSTFSSKLYVVKKQENGKTRNLLDDTISLPRIESERFLIQDCSTVEISNNSNEQNTVFAKVTKYDSDKHTVQMPVWMVDRIKSKTNDMVKIVSKPVKNITKIKVKCPKEITNSLGILEFEMRDRNLLYKDDSFEVKMFEKTYIFTVTNIYSQSNEIDVGTLYGSGLTSEIIFDIEQY